MEKGMSYFEAVRYFNKTGMPGQGAVSLPDGETVLTFRSFTSEGRSLLPHVNRETVLEKIGAGFDAVKERLFYKEIDRILQMDDSRVKENTAFRYPLFLPRGKEAPGVILLLHGLNEKQWDKYLPWAYELCRQTGYAVLLFPIAFHMTRSPGEWSDPRLMNRVSKDRQKLFPNIVASSLANAAISTRLQQLPQRFFWSGLVTFFDITQVISTIRKGGFAGICKEAPVHFFAYSVGAYLAQVLFLTGQPRLDEGSRLFIFCGGAAFNRMNPVSREIVDSEANIAVYSFFIEHLDKEVKKDPRLAFYFNDPLSPGYAFRMMLHQNRMEEIRESKLKALAGRVRAMVLKGDTVVPPYETVNLLKGNERELPIIVDIEDPPYSASHVKPFSEGAASEKKAVEAFFSKVFGTASSFFMTSP
jgi:hypothetical protein